MTDKKDRRALRRISLPGATVQYRFNKGLNIFKSYSSGGDLVNLSKSGVCFYTRENVEFGTPVNLKIVFPDGHNLELKGKTRWQNNLSTNGNKRVGIQFNPFGYKSQYNPVRALEFLRSIKDLGIQRSKKSDLNDDQDGK